MQDIATTRLAGRTLNGLVVRASAYQAGDQGSNPGRAVFPVQPVVLQPVQESEYCLCHQIEWGKIPSQGVVLGKYPGMWSRRST